jgi:hypothetical protein
MCYFGNNIVVYECESWFIQVVEFKVYNCSKYFDSYMMTSLCTMPITTKNK